MSAPHRFDEASLHCQDDAPGETLLRSTDIGWTSALVALFRCDATGGAHETRATTDLRISLLLKGEMDVDVLRRGVWERTRLRPGCAAVAPGATTQRLRWRSIRPAGRPEIIHLYLPSDLVRDALERSRSAHGQRDLEALGSPCLHDPVVATVGRSLLKAIGRGAPDLYAEAAARWLATYLAWTVSNWAAPEEPEGAGILTDRNVARALEYMSEHLSQPLTLDILAGQAGVSKFHFSRRFKAGVGATPFSHLLRLRLEAGRRMLATTNDPIGRVANACGYERGSHFGTAFAKRYGETPTAFRHRSRA